MRNPRLPTWPAFSLPLPALPAARAWVDRCGLNLALRLCSHMLAHMGRAYTVQHVSNTVWALATLGHKDERLLHEVAGGLVSVGVERLLMVGVG